MFEETRTYQVDLFTCSCQLSGKLNTYKAGTYDSNSIELFKRIIHFGDILCIFRHIKNTFGIIVFYRYRFHWYWPGCDNKLFILNGTCLSTFYCFWIKINGFNSIYKKIDSHLCRFTSTGNHVILYTIKQRTKNIRYPTGNQWFFIAFDDRYFFAAVILSWSTCCNHSCRTSTNNKYVCLFHIYSLIL